MKCSEIRITTHSHWLVIKLICFFFSMGTVTDAIAIDLNLSGYSGVDSNPLELSSLHDPDTDVFALTEVRFAHKFDNQLFFKATGKQADFLDEERANWSKSKFDLGYKSDFEIRENNLRYEVSIDNSRIDKNYVSKTTGLDATFNGESIVDRYDFEMANLNASISYKSEEKTKYELSYQHRQKDYQNFSITGLSNIDYDHDRLKFSVRYQMSEQGRLKVGVGTTIRDFKDRRIDDINGDDIPDTNLEYDYLDYSLGYEYQQNEKFQIRSELRFIDRMDNGVGYADSNYDSLVLSARYALDREKSISASMRYSEYSFPNQLTANAALQEEDVFARNGYVFEFGYQQVLYSQDERNLTAFLTFKISDFESPNSLFQFNRNILSGGIRYNLF